MRGDTFGGAFTITSNTDIILVTNACRQHRPNYTVGTIAGTKLVFGVFFICFREFVIYM